jgi:purine-binding chemotaxis protein CheW
MKDILSEQAYIENGFFSLRGDLDGEHLNEYSEVEQLIGLAIAKEEFLLPISEISEILLLPPITYVPRAPKYIEGVINLRGTIVPVINLRKISGADKGKNTITTRVVVVKKNDSLYGLIVDNITNVRSLTPGEIDNKSLPLKNSTAEIITRISKKDDAIHGILNVQKIIEYVYETKESNSSDDGAA